MGLIYLDTCLVIYALEDDPVFGARTRQAMAAAADARFAISPLVKLECLSAPMRDGNLVLQRHYEAGLARFRMLPMVEEVFDIATQLRARFGLKTPDALHLACAQHHGCSALWTRDRRLEKASRGMAGNILADRLTG